jgi:hypothetical protein
MNAAAKPTLTNEQIALTEALDQRKWHQTRVQQAADELEVAQKVLADKSIEFQKALETEQSAEIDHAPAAATVRRATEDMAAAARRKVQAAEKKLADMKSALGMAEAVVAAAADRILEAEDIELARQIAHHLDEAARLGRTLMFATINRDMNRRPSEAPTAAEIATVCELLNSPVINGLHIPVNQLSQGDPELTAKRAARRAAMIAVDNKIGVEVS